MVDKACLLFLISVWMKSQTNGLESLDKLLLLLLILMLILILLVVVLFKTGDQ